jgi:hypothetical protein
VAGELAQIRVAPGGRDAVVDARAVAVAVPAHPEAVAVGRLGAHARVQALVDDPVLGFEEQLVDKDGLPVPCHPTTHRILLRCRRIIEPAPPTDVIPTG